MRAIQPFTLVTLAISLAVCLTCSAWAQAPAVDPIADQVSEAGRAYEAGRFQEAVDAYVSAYQIEPVTALLINIAFIYDEHLEAPTLARDYYRRYVAAPDPDPKVRITAFERINAIDDLLLKAKTEPAFVAPPTPTREGTSAQTTLGYVTVGVSAAALATGVVLATLTTSTQTEFDDATDVLARRDLADQGRSLAIAADVTLGVGLALAGVGAWLILSDEDDAPVTGPAIIEHSAGWAVSGRF